MRFHHDAAVRSHLIVICTPRCTKNIGIPLVGAWGAQGFSWNQQFCSLGPIMCQVLGGGLFNICGIVNGVDGVALHSDYESKLRQCLCAQMSVLAVLESHMQVEQRQQSPPVVPSTATCTLVILQTPPNARLSAASSFDITTTSKLSTQSIPVSKPTSLYSSISASSYHTSSP